MTSSPAPHFELRSGETWRDPYGMYTALRDHDPVHHVVDGDYYVQSVTHKMNTKPGEAQYMQSFKLVREGLSSTKSAVST